MAVDAASGVALDHKPNPVIVTMQPAAAVPAAPASAAPAAAKKPKKQKPAVM